MSTKSNLEYIIVIDKISEEARNKATELNLKLLAFDDVKEIGRSKPQKPMVYFRNFYLLMYQYLML